MKIKKGHVWSASRLEIKPAMIELRERKAFETGAVLVFVGVPIVCFLWMLVRPSLPGRMQSDLPLIIGLVMGIIGFAILLLYRPPRVLCFYPLEQVVYQHRVFLFFRFPGRWHDLSQTKPILRKTSILIEREEGMGAALLIIPMLLLGPFGLIIGLLSGGNKRAYPTYALTYKGQRGKPLAVLKNRVDGQKVIDAYDDAV